MTPLQQLSPEASVVVIRLRSVGDAVLTTPALRLLKAARPDLHVTVVMDEPLAGLLEGSPDVDRVLAVARGRTIDAVKSIRAEKPELCLNLHGGVSSAWMTLFSGAKLRVGYGHYPKSFVYNRRIPRAQEILGLSQNAAVHTAEHHASAMFYLGVERSEIPPARLYAPSAQRSERYAVLHVAATYHTKAWPIKRYVRLAEAMQVEMGIRPVIIAGPGADQLLGAFPRETETKANLSIEQMKSLIGGARLFVGNDSGPAHVAAAFGVPSVVLFGSSSSELWGPWRNRHEVVETAWDCKPCPGDRCRAFEEPRCILSIERAEVEEAIRRVLGEKARPPLMQ